MRKKGCLKAALVILGICLLAGCGNKGVSDASASADETIGVEKNEVEKTEADSNKTKEDSFYETVKLTNPSEAWDALEYDEFYLPSDLKVIKFSGVQEKTYKSDDYGVYVSDRYVLLVDKNVELPGNYAIMLDDLCEAVETVTGLKLGCVDNDFKNHMRATSAGEMPWKELVPGDKYVIQLNYSDNMYGSYAAPDWKAGYLLLNDTGIYTFQGEKICDSDYNRFLDLLTHNIFTPYYPSKACEPMADTAVYGRLLERMAEKHPDFARVIHEVSYYNLASTITAENVEYEYVNRDKVIDSSDKRYAFSELFVLYLTDRYGDGVLKRVLSPDASNNTEFRSELVTLYKEVLGDDVFIGFVDWLKDSAPKAAVEITFSGDKNDVITTEGPCYAEGEKCFLYIDKGLSVPGDYLKNADMIVAKLEEDMLGKDTSVRYNNQCGNTGVFDGISSGDKLSIKLKLDEDNMGYISYSTGEEIVIYDYGMDKRKNYEIEYDTLAHEASHAVFATKRGYMKTGRIFVEGSADYYAERVIDEIGTIPAYEKYHYYDYKTPLNSNTAEEIFKNDFSDLSHAERGMEYEVGFWFTKFLVEAYGDGAFLEVYNALNESNITLSDGEYGDASDREIRVSVMKNLYGADIYEKFGAWYTKNSKR